MAFFIPQQPEFADPRLAAARRRMVEEQLAGRGIDDPRVLAAMGSVPREFFVPAEYRSDAYDDNALPIEAGQTISQPYTVAFMLAALRLTGDERVLEIGAGSGYSAAVLSRLAQSVHTIESRPELARLARERLAALGCRNAHVHQADGTRGWPEGAPYDAIVVTAGGRELPPAYREQLAPGGRIVIPLGETASRQTMFRFTRAGDELVAERLGAFAFVPLVGEFGWPER